MASSSSSSTAPSSSTTSLLFYGTILLLSVFALQWLFAPLLLASSSAASSSSSTHAQQPQQERRRKEEEEQQQSEENQELSAQPPQHQLSLIIPAYNEIERLPIMLHAAVDYLDREAMKTKVGGGIEQQQQSVLSGSGTYEIIVVDDGSVDGTRDILGEFMSRKAQRGSSHGRVSDPGDGNESGVHVNESGSGLNNTWRTIVLPVNRGKGAAIRTGMLAATGKYLLMVDADGATEISDLNRVMSKMKEIEVSGPGSENESFGVVIGSRAHMANEAGAERSLVRTLLMKAFHVFVSILCSSKVKDTQCGFKLFTASASHIIFNTLHLERWAFDIEVVSIAEMLNIPLEEVGVNWQEVDGSKLATSKLSLLINSANMLRDMICVRVCYMMQIWKVDAKSLIYDSGAKSSSSSS
jgi:dolichyl-phosphate beta-glucosyltransferase